MTYRSNNPNNSCRRFDQSSFLTSVPLAKRSGSGRNGTLGIASKSGGNAWDWFNHFSHGSLRGKMRSISASSASCRPIACAPEELATRPASSETQRSPQDRRQSHGEQAALRLLPLPARNERGEGRGEGKALKTLPENDLGFPRHPS